MPLLITNSHTIGLASKTLNECQNGNSLSAKWKSMFLKIVFINISLSLKNYSILVI